MSAHKELFRVISNVMYGISIKPINQKKKYTPSDIILKSLNEWNYVAMKYKLLDKNGELVAPKHESDMIFNFLGVDSSEWSKRIINNGDEIESMISYTPLIEKISNTTYILTEEGKEFASQCSEYNADEEQNKFFRKLRGLDSECYIFIRRFIIENPIATNYKLGAFKNQLINRGITDQLIHSIISLGYEDIPINASYKCPYCGWTAQSDRGGGYSCSHPRCKEEMKVSPPLTIHGIDKSKRVKPGINRFIVIPGLLELEINSFCDDHGIKCELWPEKDKYDCKIILPNQEIIAIDAKDYVNPYNLAYKLEQESDKLKQLEGTRKYIVVPDDAGGNRKDYCKVIDNKLPKEIKCIKMKELFQELKGEKL